MSRTAEERVRAVAPLQRVVALAPEDLVVAGAAEDDIVAERPGDDVGLRRAGHLAVGEDRGEADRRVAVGLLCHQPTAEIPVQGNRGIDIAIQFFVDLQHDRSGKQS